jgi:RNA recognition motif-containing protein
MGVIYVGHLPYGFVEEGLKEYFGQYGEVKDVKLGRSKKVKIGVKGSQPKFVVPI